jgi:acyl-CoA reductase-like NAD-dependent aldehyde dehydrogenase
VIDNEILVAGLWRRGNGGDIVSTNPADGSVNATINAASEADVIEAIERAHDAARQPAWRDAKPHERAGLLHAIAAGIRDHAEELAQLQTRDTGKCIRETRALVASAAATFQYVAAALETLENEITPSRGDYVTMSTWEPLGVVAAISPWNSPIASDAQKIAPALAGGNAVIVKPAEWTSLVSLRLARIIEAAGLPPGLLSVLPGPGRVIGDVIVKHPLVRKVSFTGGTTTGRVIARAAAEKLMPVTLELGGKSPTIVLPDADRETALNGVLYGIFSSTGQSCIAGSRLFVHESIYDEFVAELVERTKALQVGHPDNPATRVAPMVALAHRDSVARYVDLAREEGAEVLCGGRIPTGPDYDNGAYYLPTILQGLDNSARVCQEEIFGPVLVAMQFSSDEELIKMANHSVFGLACGIWTENYRRAAKLARAIEAGTVWINTYKQFSASTPFGAGKDSGVGSEKGRLGIRNWMQQKSLYWGTGETPIPWANPE